MNEIIPIVTAIIGLCGTLGAAWIASSVVRLERRIEALEKTMADE